jgi:hypothetical protein
VEPASVELNVKVADVVEVGVPGPESMTVSGAVESVEIVQP